MANVEVGAEVVVVVGEGVVVLDDGSEGGGEMCAGPLQALVPTATARASREAQARVVSWPGLTRPAF